MKFFLFYAEWCGPSVSLYCTIKCDFSEVPVECIEIETHPDLAKANRVHATPTLLRIGIDGKEKRLVGNQARETLQSFFGMRNA